MAIKWISDAWKADLKNTWPPDQRVYIDFRQQQYPIVAGTPTFTAVTSADNRPGSHYMSGGYGKYLMPSGNYVVVDVLTKPTFAYDTADQKFLFAWYVSATQRLRLWYEPSNDTIALGWKDGGTERYLGGSAYLSDEQLQVWARHTFVLDLSTAQTTGSGYYLNGSAVDTNWGGNIDVKATNFPTFELRGLSGTAYEYDIAYCRIWMPSSAADLPTATDVANNFKTYKEEEIVFHLNGHATGHTRCNVSDRVQSFEIEKTTESPAGTANPNVCDINLMSPNGQFADDQYAAFDAGGEVYNGTSAQKYLQARCPVEVETWYGNTYELEFVGRVDDNLFKRRSSFNDVSRVAITAKDAAEDMRRRVRQKAYTYENYELCNTTTSTTSLLHTIAQMEGQKEWYNFLANSSFENATSANSWTVAGSSSTITRAAGGLLGSYQLDWLVPGATATLTQTVTFAGSKVLNVGQQWTASIWGKTATGITATLYVNELASGGTALTSADVEEAFVTAANWVQVTNTITVSTSLTNSLQVQLLATATATLSLDCASLIQNREALNWFVLNNNDGAAGVESADDADSATYDTMGFDVDDAMVIHPWAVVNQGHSIWDYLVQIGDATAARYIGMDSCGTFKYRTIFKTGYADPSSLASITDTDFGTVATVMDCRQANKIVIHGYKIFKDGVRRHWWRAQDTDVFDRTENSGAIYESVDNGDTWPDPDTYGDFWAQYNEDDTALYNVPWNKVK